MQHLETLVRDWFPGVFIGPGPIQDKSTIPSFAPCWKCLHPASTPPTTTKIFGVTSVVAVGLRTVYCFPVGQCIEVISQQKKTVECPFHGELLVDCVMPDLVSCCVHHTSQHALCCSWHAIVVVSTSPLMFHPMWCGCTPARCS